MSFFCKLETSSGDAELGGDGGVLAEDSFFNCDTCFAGSEVGKGVARSLDARSWAMVLPLPSACAALSLPDFSSTGDAASASFFCGLALIELQLRVDSKPYFCTVSSMYLWSFSFRKPLHSVPPCPSKTPK